MSDNNNCPCKDCVPPKRFPSCHGACEEYITWSKKHISHKMAVKAMKEKQAMCDSYSIGVAEKLRK